MFQTPTQNADQGRLIVRTGRFGRFATARMVTLQGAPLLQDSIDGDFDILSTTPGGVALAADGGLTVGWIGCGPRSCARRGVYGETGTVARGADGRATLIAPAHTGTILRGLVTDGAVAFSSSRRRSPTRIAVSVAGAPGGPFAPAQTIATGGRLLGLVSDRHGDLLLTYADARGALYAVTKAASSIRFGAPMRLSAPADVTLESVTSAYGPRGEAIVAWSHRERTVVAIDRGDG